jgi:hypothetical protein
MAFIKEKYSESRVSMIYELLKKDAGNDAPKEYDIKVDELKVVSRNNDPERFYDFEQFVLLDSKNITINIHDKSHRSVRYILLLQEEEPTKEELSGIEKSISIKMQHEKAKWEHGQLQRDYDELKEKLRECEEYSGQLKEKIDVLETEKNSRSGNMTNSIVGLVGTYLNSNPDALKGIPVIGGMFGGNKKGLPQGNLSGANDQGACSCKDMPQQYTGEITVRDDQRLNAALVPYFKREYIDRVMKLILHFFHHNHFIDQAIKGIDQAVNNGSKQKQQAGK